MEICKRQEGIGLRLFMAHTHALTRERERETRERCDEDGTNNSPQCHGSLAPYRPVCMRNANGRVNDHTPAALAPD